MTTATQPECDTCHKILAIAQAVVMVVADVTYVSLLRFHAADDCHSALVPFAVNGGRPGACPASLSAWLAMSWSQPHAAARGQ